LLRRKGFQLLAGICMLTAALPTVAWAKKHPVVPPAPAISPDEQAAQSIYAASPDGVAAFYAYRHNAPFWLSRAGVPNPAVPQMLTILKRAQFDGFADGPALAAQAEAAVAAAQDGNAAKVAYAERLLSSTWVRYVQALNAPAAGFEYAVPYLAPKPVRGEDVLFAAFRATSLEDHLKAVSDLSPIYVQLRDAIMKQVQAGAPLDRRMLDSLERARMLPATGRLVLVDAASQRLFMIEDGQIKDSMKVVVGMYYDQDTKVPTPQLYTPLVVSMISYATFNPYWHVPPHLVVKTISKNALQIGPSYFKSRKYQVVDAYVEHPNILDPSKVDWKAVAAGQQKVWVRQLPGPTNSLGFVKFQFPNSTGVYLHDSPEREYFQLAQRTKSNGCIRLEDARRFGRWLMGRDPVPPSPEPEQNVLLPQSVPVYVSYFTAWADNGQLVLRDDFYGRDTDGIAATKVATLK
jgi:murein L,D-transpeptidase YcbB/YkuD